MEERKGFGSNFGFLMAAVGSAVGLGNICLLYTSDAADE